MAVKCKECGAFMKNMYDGHTRSWWKCLNCGRENSISLKEITENSDNFI